jgi:hypothetical protein
MTTKRAVIVTDTGYGVHFGYTTEDGRADSIELTDSRNAYVWKVPVGTGIAALASVGPQADSRIGETAAKVIIRNVARVYECSAEAEQAWKRATWAK